MVHCMGRFLRRRNDKLRRRRTRPSIRVKSLETERGFRIVGNLDILNAHLVMKVLRPELHGTLALDLAAYTGFVQPVLEPEIDAQGDIAGVRIVYPLDFSRQMLAYAERADA